MFLQHVPAQVALQRLAKNRDTSKYGNFDADDLCRRLEKHKAKEKAAERKQAEQEKGSNAQRPGEAIKTLSSCQSMAKIPSTVQTHLRVAPDKPFECWRENQRLSESNATSSTSKAALIGRQLMMSSKRLSSSAPKRDQESPIPNDDQRNDHTAADHAANTSVPLEGKGQDGQIRSPGGVEKPSPYVPQSAASAFARTTTREKAELQGDKPTEDCADERRSSSFSSESHEGDETNYKDIVTKVRDLGMRDRVKTLRGSIYESSQQKHWAQSDESIREKGNFRQRLTHLKMLSPRLRHNDRR